jgi:serine/threonine-protein kinase
LAVALIASGVAAAAGLVLFVLWLVEPDHAPGAPTSATPPAAKEPSAPTPPVAPPIETSAETAAPAPPPSQAASASPPRYPRRPGLARPPAPRPPQANCSPPYRIDAEGVRIPKPECFK